FRHGLVRGDQPANAAERAAAPAERVLRTPVASATGDTVGAPAGGGRSAPVHGISRNIRLQMPGERKSAAD
ncbi:hypothetical protein K4G99_24280, partial [Mycobacterium tuberculosis]|nr:hypothetical protein [Mycobacterium tuberculosis]